MSDQQNQQLGPWYLNPFVNPLADPAPIVPAYPMQQGAPAKDAINQKAKTYDDGKAALAVLPWAGLTSMALVQSYGERKYGDFYNYRKGMEVSRNLSCAIRHIRDFMEGQDMDPESKESHLGHAMVRLGYVLQNIADGTVIDDRYARREKK